MNDINKGPNYMKKVKELIFKVFSINARFVKTDICKKLKEINHIGIAMYCVTVFYSFVHVSLKNKHTVSAIKLL